MLGFHSRVSDQQLLPKITTCRSFSAFPLTFTSIFFTNMKVHKIMPLRIGAKVCTPESDSLPKLPRRSANYHPSIWKRHLIESTTNPYADECLKERLEELKLEASSLLQSCKEPSDCLQLIDSMQRLGVAYHYEKEIKEALEKVLAYDFDDLYETALCFRLLRQHGHPVSSDVFNKFRDEKGFKDCLIQDVSGLLSLYEASHLAVDGEELAEAQEFSVRHLKSLERHLDANLAEQIRHALEFPLHWRMPRLEARNFIDIYQKEGKSPILLEFAKLDFNIVQSIHQKEVKELSRWWTDLGLTELKFSRDRLLENYLWAAGIAPEPQFSKCRMGLTKLVCILTVIDDIYDVYGLFGEVQSFTQAIRSWDPKATGGLPDYQKLCYMALYNFVKEIAQDIFEDHGWDITSFSQREWERLCGAYLVEAEWFHQEYKPSLKEYLNNAWISVGGPISMVHVYLLFWDTRQQTVPISWNKALS